MIGPKGNVAAKPITEARVKATMGQMLINRNHPVMVARRRYRVGHRK